MCIALTEFTGLCGFRPQNETLGFVNSIPELKELIGDVDLSTEEGYSTNLKKAFTNLMQNSKETIIEKVGSTTKVILYKLYTLTVSNVTKPYFQANALVDRVKADTSEDAETKYLKTLLLTLNEKYSGDIGLFNIYFLNHVNLQVSFKKTWRRF